MEDIKLLRIDYEYSTFYTYGMEAKFLCGIIVEFDYKKIERCKLRIETNKELSIEEIKERIWRNIR
ncbi:hypothetical protein FDA77_19110 [Clostridium botulinum]|uniref:hypothetical protein n=1 Tax=Clostridium botulinum TaxID=1491 RepID=UPI0013FA81BE|nr:hypothetical protein [Clostridium botulinum]MBY6888778.1 hypothetical protein [Clostridium botulinum]NFI47931.1 hypothetical protein [Clostridium botulinum]NFJ91938.1 hypothetical protein [Clostridium botulinum]NFO72159.1 hypothetical protein [Clostridium botulinum]HBJ2609708.1 hypothetical protein [Clostridium botulinum]